MGNSLDYALVFLAANAIGAVPIPASPMLTAREVAGLLADSGARLIAWDGLLDLPDRNDPRLLPPDAIARLKTSPRGSYAATAADDPGYLIYTSGTSGKPKGVLHAQRAVWGRRPMYQGWYGITPDDVVLHTGAFNWTYTLGTGCSIPLPMRPPPSSIRARGISPSGSASSTSLVRRFSLPFQDLPAIAESRIQTGPDAAAWVDGG